MCKAGMPDGVGKDMALIILVINVFLPGVGTWIAAATGKKCEGSTVAVGFGHFFGSILIVGWIWAIAWSVFLFQHASEEEQEMGKAQQQAATAPVPAPEPVATGGEAYPPQQQPYKAAGAPAAAGAPPPPPPPPPPQ